MIIGSGSIAKLLNDREGFIFFAAGISDSQSHCLFSQRLRESKLITDNVTKHPSAMFVYFSTISIFTLESWYTKHKKGMENVVRGIRNHTIVRLGNVWECTNPSTFINAYKRQPYEPRDEYKYMISKEQLNFITDNLPRTGQHEISIFGEMRLVKDCL
jgi:hypothetical protein